MLLQGKATSSLDLDKKQEVKRAHSDPSPNLACGSAVSMDKDRETACNGSERLPAELDDYPLGFFAALVCSFSTRLSSALGGARTPILVIN